MFINTCSLEFFVVVTTGVVPETLVVVPVPPEVVLDGADVLVRVVVVVVDDIGPVVGDVDENVVLVLFTSVKQVKSGSTVTASLSCLNVVKLLQLSLRQVASI